MTGPNCARSAPQRRRRPTIRAGRLSFLSPHSSARRPVSRVLYSPKRTAAIHLGLPLPTGSSGQPGDGPDSRLPLLGLAPDGVCLAPGITTGTVSSYLAFSPLPAVAGGISLWHFPSGHPAPLLAGILSSGARTFLSPDTREA